MTWVLNCWCLSTFYSQLGPLIFCSSYEQMNRFSVSGMESAQGNLHEEAPARETDTRFLGFALAVVDFLGGRKLSGNFCQQWFRCTKTVWSIHKCLCRHRLEISWVAALKVTGLAPYSYTFQGQAHKSVDADMLNTLSFTLIGAWPRSLQCSGQSLMGKKKE